MTTETKAQQRVISTASEWLVEMERYSKQDTIQDKFIVDEVVFSFIEGFKVGALLYRVEDPWGIKHIGDNLPWLVNLDYSFQNQDVVLDIKSVIEDMYSNPESPIKPLTVEEALNFQNEEQKAKALKGFSPEEIAEKGGFQFLAEETIEKEQLRWTVDEEGNMIEEKVKFSDTYTLYKREIDTRAGKSVFGVIKCKDTSTDRVYWLYVDITTQRDPRTGASISWITDPIEAIASTLKLALPHESLEIEDVYQYIQRQGDVLLGKLKEEYEGAEFTCSKSLTKDQYLNMIISES